jgi:hypothetical protein
MLRCSTNLPASFIVAAVCRCHGIFIQVQLPKIFAAVTAEAKKAWPVDALEQSFFWVANFAKRLFFFFTSKKSPRPPLPSPLVTSDHCSFRQHAGFQQAAPVRRNMAFNRSLQGGLLAKTVHFLRILRMNAATKQNQKENEQKRKKDCK